MEQEVVAHIYDVTNSGSEKTNNTILHINRFFKDAIGLGGVFHTAIQVYGDEEWSFGYCDNGTGVFSCPPCKNPMYTFHESIVLGKTSCSIFMVNQILMELRWDWPGNSYDLLSRNCNHFCDALCERLEVPKLPGWVNRFANAGDAALDVAETTAVKLGQAKTEIMNAGKAAYIFLTGATSSTSSASEETQDSNSASSLFQGSSWFRNLISVGAKPSSSTAETLEDSESDDEESEDEQNSDYESEDDQHQHKHQNLDPKIDSENKR